MWKEASLGISHEAVSVLRENCVIKEPVERRRILMFKWKKKGIYSKKISLPAKSQSGKFYSYIQLVPCLNCVSQMESRDVLVNDCAIMLSPVKRARWDLRAYEREQNERSATLLWHEGVFLSDP